MLFIIGKLSDVNNILTEVNCTGVCKDESDNICYRHGDSCCGHSQLLYTGPNRGKCECGYQVNKNISIELSKQTSKQTSKS